MRCMCLDRTQGCGMHQTQSDIAEHCNTSLDAQDAGDAENLLCASGRNTH